ncbi:MAG: cation-translocating P-type ATPase [Planctomycetia bacterium]|nr:cation-translocating P-type ATPase [Planctomycetia bacterium]
MTQKIQFPEFSLPLNEGLTEQQVEEQRVRFGANSLTPPVRVPWWRLFLDKFNDPTIRILLIAAALSLLITALERWCLGNEEANFVDSIGIFLAVALATCVGFFSERKSAREFELLNKVKDSIDVKVLRNGQITTVPIESLVVGDLVRIDRGDKIPADGVILETLGLFLDQSMLTGESVPARKKSCTDGLGNVDMEFLYLKQQAVPGSDSFCARGTMVADGHGTFLVTAVGDQTQMGQIARSLTEGQESEQTTPLVEKLTQLAQQISVVGIAGATTIFSIMALVESLHSPLFQEVKQHPTSLCAWLLAAVLLGILATRRGLFPFYASLGVTIAWRWLRVLAVIPMILASFAFLLAAWGLFHSTESLPLAIDLFRNILLAFVVAVTIIVVAVPEGLPMMVTVSLAMNMMKMARQNCLVRRLVASETIGSATVICTDKTGTLTENRMTPVWLYLDGKSWTSEQFEQWAATATWQELAEGIAINSQAELHLESSSETVGSLRGIGNPTECALLTFLYQRGYDYRVLREKHPKLQELAHNSERKRSAVLVRGSDPDHLKCYVKGAPDRILPRCAQILINGEVKPIESSLPALEAALVRASESALRVLAFSWREVDPGKDNCQFCPNCPAECETAYDMVFVGLIGIADPLRKEVPDAVRTCQTAGVEVKMITGDALPTAVAIAREAGIYSGAAGELALTSDEFNRIDDRDLPGKAKAIKVLARSTPMDKLRLVKALHEKSEVVAMTGDGTNDAPALKHADVGLAMGITGTEVAKEAGDIVLLDDNFSSIVTGVWWGRTLFANIQRFLQFQLSVNVVALLAALLGPLVGIPLPLTVTQLLWINIIMDTFAAIALSTEPPREYMMKEKPIPRNAHIITPTMGITILLVSLYQVGMLFAALFGGWFVEPEHVYDFAIEATDSDYLEHNLQPLTVFFTLLVMFQFWHKINCRALRANESPLSLIFKNKLFIIIILTITLVQVIMVQSPVVGQFFRTEPLSLSQWLEITALSFTVMPVAWLAHKLAWFYVERKNASTD